MGAFKNGMDNDMSNNKKAIMENLMVILTSYHKERLRNYAKKLHLPLGRMINIALDNELLRDKPFNFPLDLPKQDLIPDTYAIESKKILDFLRGQRIGCPLDLLMLFRYDIGVFNKDVFLAAFKDLLDQNLIAGFKPDHRKDIDNFPEDYLYYRVVDDGPKKVSLKKEAKQYEQYIKLRKKFENKKEI